MKLSVCLLFLGCLVLAAAALPAKRQEMPPPYDLEGLLTKLEDLVDGLEVADVGMETRGLRQCKKRCPGLDQRDKRRDCLRRCESRYAQSGPGKRDEVEDLVA
ncbi:uncharacterized protein LOC144903151 [Branchiostoma floridae x Branchiostoma belcheri]